MIIGKVNTQKRSASHIWRIACHGTGMYSLCYQWTSVAEQWITRTSANPCKSCLRIAAQIQRDKETMEKGD